MARYLTKWLAGFLMAALACQCLVQANAGASFSSQVVAQQGGQGVVFFDSQNNPHIFYYIRSPGPSGIVTHAAYAEWTGESWDHQGVNTNSSGIFIMDTNHRPHIVNVSNGTLKDLAIDGLNWDFQENPFSQLADSTMALDSNGSFHQIYANQTYTGALYLSSLTYAKWSKTDGYYYLLDNETTTSSIEGFEPLAVAIDSRGYPRVIYAQVSEYPSIYNDKAFLSTHTIKYAAWTGSDWIIQTVATNITDPSGFRNLVLDSQGQPRICFIRENITSQPATRSYSASVTLEYAYFDGSTWTCLDVKLANNDNFINSPYLRLDAMDNPQIYGLNISGTRGAQSIDIICAKLSGAEWVTENIGNFQANPDAHGGIGVDDLTLAFDLYGNPCCIYDTETGTYRSGPIYGYLTYVSLNTAPTFPLAILSVAVGIAVGIAVITLAFLVLKRRKTSSKKHNRPFRTAFSVFPLKQGLKPAHL